MAIVGKRFFPPDGKLHEVAFYNEYGLTEDTVWATLLRLERGTARLGVTVDRSIANTSIYILGNVKQPVAIGVPGNL